MDPDNIVRLNEEHAIGPGETWEGIETTLPLELGETVVEFALSTRARRVGRRQVGGRLRTRAPSRRHSTGPTAPLGRAHGVTSCPRERTG